MESIHWHVMEGTEEEEQDPTCNGAATTTPVQVEGQALPSSQQLPTNNPPSWENSSNYSSTDESLEEGQLVDTPLKKFSWKRFTHHPWRKMAEDRWGNRNFDTSSSEGYEEMFTTSYPQA